MFEGSFLINLIKCFINYYKESCVSLVFNKLKHWASFSLMIKLWNCYVSKKTTYEFSVCYNIIRFFVNKFDLITNSIYNFVWKLYCKSKTYELYLFSKEVSNDDVFLLLSSFILMFSSGYCVSSLLRGDSSLFTIVFASILLVFSSVFLRYKGQCIVWVKESFVYYFIKYILG